MEGTALSLYFHIPFCVQKCNYCDFCSFPRADGELKHRYVLELCRRLEAFRDGIPYGKYRVETVYFGGGTPTLLSPKDIALLMKTVRLSFPMDHTAEVTAECNPGTVDFDYLSAIADAGVNRLSIGMQSANENELRLLGRIHSTEDFLRCAGDAYRAGFRDISADIMFGIPCQTPESFRHTLKTVLSVDPMHVSAYGLKIEDGTPFGKQRDRLVLPSEDAEEEMYRDACEILASHGLYRYEISNFAKTGYYSVHNRAYWTLQDYLGLGVAAHSYLAGERIANSRDLDAFLRGEDITESRARIGREESMEEYVMLGMRLECGVKDASFDEFFGEKGLFARRYAPKLKHFADLGFVRTETHDGKTAYAFTTGGFRVSNYILSEILG